MKLQHIFQLTLILTTCIIQGQTKQTAEFKPGSWEVKAKNHEFKEFKGKQALFLDQGIARLKNSDFRNGIIEYDISFEQKRNFAGVHFHILDSLNYEEYYLRPHQSGNPDAMQYTPVINGNAGWQLYHGEGYWSAFPYRFNEWMHVKLIVLGNRMQVFMDDMEEPILNVHDLKLDEKVGGLGFGTFLGAAHYANLTYEESNDVKFVKIDQEENGSANSEGAITSYEVSEAFSAESLNGIIKLKDLGIKTNKKMETEDTGLLNLSKVSPVGDGTNTILAKFTVSSGPENGNRKLHFGYSDKVKVFVNGQLVYEGDNSFRSRDYRYLGSIGFFDAIVLKLEKGQNEIVFAVTERMGGWGVMARFSEDQKP